jgi:hypothetical protein
MKAGTNDHRKRFCRAFLDSHTQWDTEQLSWPPVDSVSQERLQSIPGWSKILQKKQKLSQVTTDYAATVKNPLVRDAIARLGEEQQRQATALKKLMSTYDLPRTSRSPLASAQALEADFIQANNGACLDAFWHFGWFGLAQNQHFLPAELLEPCDRCLQETARQLVFFVDWLSYHRARQRKWGLEWGSLPNLWRDRGTILQTISTFGFKEDQAASPLNQLLQTTTAEEYLNICLTEYQRRMAWAADDIPQPQLGVATAKVLREVVRLWPQRRETATIYDMDPDQSN